jgi:hypothetical protein
MNVSQWVLNIFILNIFGNYTALVMYLVYCIGAHCISLPHIGEIKVAYLYKAFPIVKVFPFHLWGGTLALCDYPLFPQTFYPI